MAALINPRKFLAIWNTSSSLTEVSVRLRQDGIGSVAPDACLVIAVAFGMCGYDVKPMPLPDLPSFSDPDEGLVTFQRRVSMGPTPPLAVPDSVAECEVAAKHAAADRHQRGADPSYTGWYMQERWAFKHGSND